MGKKHSLQIINKHKNKHDKKTAVKEKFNAVKVNIITHHNRCPIVSKILSQLAVVR